MSKQIVVKSQADFEKITRIEADEEVICEIAVRFTGKIEILGRIIFKMAVDCNYYEDRYLFVPANSAPSIVARENSAPRIEARANSAIQGSSITSLKTKVSLFGYSVISLLADLKIKVKKTKTAHVQRVKAVTDWFERNGVQRKKKVVLYKRVSSDFKTQENCPNETLWAIGSTVEHKNWNPSESECGEGKFHAVSHPYFADEFRDKAGDRYIAIEITSNDLHEWKNPQYPHKIGFRKGKVLYECDRFGVKKGGAK